VTEQQHDHLAALSGPGLALGLGAKRMLLLRVALDKQVVHPADGQIANDLALLLHTQQPLAT
jgi:hypothetical protein